MQSIKNTTHMPLRVSLPQGKVMHLGPQKTGQISPKAAEHPAVKALVEAGKIEIVDLGKSEAPSAAATGGNTAASQGHHGGTDRRSSGDR
jgi:hypothetical protein